MILTGFHTLFAALHRAGFLHLPFWLARYRRVMTTFLSGFRRGNRTAHSGLILKLLYSGLFLELKEKFAGAGGIKGRLPRVYLTHCSVRPNVCNAMTSPVIRTQCTIHSYIFSRLLLYTELNKSFISFSCTAYISVWYRLLFLTISITAWFFIYIY